MAKKHKAAKQPDQPPQPRRSSLDLGTVAEDQIAREPDQQVEEKPTVATLAGTTIENPAPVEYSAPKALDSLPRPKLTMDAEQEKLVL